MAWKREKGGGKVGRGGSRAKEIEMHNTQAKVLLLFKFPSPKSSLCL